jgi:hypothetical protein
MLRPHLLLSTLLLLLLASPAAAKVVRKVKVGNEITTKKLLAFIESDLFHKPKFKSDTDLSWQTTGK